LTKGLRIKVFDMKEFVVWQEDGKVKQKGIDFLPECLENFGNTKQGRFKAVSYISGMIKLKEIINQYNLKQFVKGFN